LQSRIATSSRPTTVKAALDAEIAASRNAFNTGNYAGAIAALATLEDDGRP
jgi:hypothetical protein